MGAKIIPPFLPLSIDSAFSADEHVMPARDRDQRLMPLGQWSEPADGILVKVVAEQNCRALVEIKLHTADELDRAGQECAFWHNHATAACGFASGYCIRE